MGDLLVTLDHLAAETRDPELEALLRKRRDAAAS